jgi:serine/threonine protein kinase
MPSLDRIGNYEIIREIGRGGMGQVLLARDTILGRTVAIKVISRADAPELAERFRTEARTLALLSHPAIVTIYQLGTTDDYTYIVMEYVNGHTLQTLFETRPKEEWSSYIPALAQCAEALDFAHRRGVVHRDVKPANIMIGADGAGRILDFGIAKMLANDSSQTQTREGDVIGTVRYMAPEQLMGAAVGPATDEFALALIVYMSVAGQYPFEAPNVGSVMHAILSRDLPAASSVNPRLSPAVDSVLARALAKKPAERYASCAEFMMDFRNAWDRFDDVLLSTASRSPRSDQPPPPPSVVASAPVAARASAPKGFFPNLPIAVARAVQWIFTRTAPATTNLSPPAVLSRPAGDEPTGLLNPDPADLVSPPRESVLEGTRPFPAPERFPDALTNATLTHAPSTHAPAAAAMPVPAPPGEFTRLFQAAPQTVILQRPPDQRLDPETQARAQARELIEMIRARDFESAVALRGKWLPGVAGATGELFGLQRGRTLPGRRAGCSQSLRANRASQTRRGSLDLGRESTPRVNNAVGAFSSRSAGCLEGVCARSACRSNTQSIG